MANRYPKNVRSNLSLSGQFTTPTFRGDDVDACILTLSLSGVNSGLVTVKLWGVNQQNQNAYLIDTAPDYSYVANTPIDLGYAYGNGAIGGFQRAQACILPYEYFFTITNTASINTGVSIETVVQ